MNIGIVGIGVVGSAIKKYYENKDYNLKLFDKYKNIGNIENLLECEFIFLCLPTPFKNNEYDITEINSICEILSTNNFSNILILKSTLTPGITQSLIDKYNLNIVHNPEFLSEKTAYKDFQNQTHIILGGKENLLKKVHNFYENDFSNIEYSFVSSEESEMIKLAANNFYCVKIQFFTELYLLCDKLNINFENVKNGMLKNNWIHPQHTNVPGRDGKVSYGGMCFPKDSNAFYNFIKQHSNYYKLIQSTIEERNSLRID